MRGKFLLIIFVLVFVFAAYASAFSISDDFSNTTLNTAVYSNLSVKGNITMNISGGSLNFAGNSSGSTQYNGGAYLTTKLMINTSYDGSMSFKYQINKAFDVSTFFYASLGYPLASSGVGVTIAGGDSVYVVNYATGLRACSTDTKPLDLNQHTVYFIVHKALPDVLYSVYYDGAFWCQVTQTAIVNLPANFTLVSSNNSYHTISIDDFTFTDNTSALDYGNGTVPNNEYCKNNADCISQNCQYHKCASKMGGQTCVHGFECLSGVCNGGYCTYTDALTNLMYFKNELFGTGGGVDNFISLFLAIGGGIAVIIAGSVIGGVIVMVMGVIFFTLIGMLTPLFLIGLTLIGLIVIVLAVVIGGRGT